ncbi:MAG: endonuclease domain-containing protein [Bacteroidetes bacterium]|nr:endonuclease domain-containing protein [Bacteroidota bacterium]MBU1485458.1 endonuclease domain-containing protein [Bacteroidota bacterium]MBU2267236.1 endonuclease domain-containing protein [Bacteroidota bacterium]MBU2376357.1 endonuclease domain-containing protein [Bacteroidota bacterium]
MDSKSFRRLLRKESTPSEMRMWFILRNRKFGNYKFRRQHQIEKYIVDFYCHELKLIIEIDGKVHDELGQSNYDFIRDEYLKSLGNYVVRYDNEIVYKWPENFLADLEKLIKELNSCN